MERYHPIIHFIYFCMVIGFSMVWRHPVCLLISMLCAGAYTFFLFGKEQTLKGMRFMVILMLFTAVLNPAFSHQGMTVLAYLPTGNVLTLESVCFGVSSACMLAAVLMWFRCMSEVITSDKIVYLFGKVVPVLALLLSMILGFVPKIQKKFLQIRLARGERHPECTNKLQAFLYGMRRGIENLSILITWVLEDAVDMADNMKGKGYGLEGRTTFTTYRFTGRDRRMTILLLLEFVYLLAGDVCKGTEWYYYPSMEGAGFSIYSISVYVVYLLMCATPLLLEYCEEKRWNKLQSVI